MKDAVSIPRVKLLHPKVRDEVAELISKAEAILPDNVAIRIVQGLRTIPEQDAIYAQGRTKPGPIVTKAKGGLSYHNYGLAIDIAFVVDKDRNGSYETLEWGDRQDFNKNGITDWKEIVKVFKEAGYVWGADWDNDGITKAEGDKDEHLVDAPHLQKSFGFSTKQLFVMYNREDFIYGTNYVNIR